MTFTVLNKDGSCPCADKRDAMRAAHNWVIWAKRCAQVRGLCYAQHRLEFDDTARTIKAECFGMSAAWTY